MDRHRRAGSPWWPLVALVALSSSPGRAHSEPPSAPVSLASFPAPKQLGLRVSIIERQFQIIPTVVVVPDEASYIAAVSRWQTTESGALRYPVLIDDGTWSSRMAIARFVRAFGPKAVVRWKSAQPRWPDAPAERQSLIENAAAAAWGAPNPTELKKRWSDQHFDPPGAVVANAADPAWTAALALAAGHGQPILWLDKPPGEPPGYVPLENADLFNGAIMRALDSSGFAYKALADQIDAITLCMATPTKCFLGPGEKHHYFALSDLVGRAAPPPGKAPSGEGRERWAWCGQIMGTAPHAAYIAMCALFLQPETAWLFDGYDGSAPGDWDKFDMTRAAQKLEKFGLRVALDDAPRGMGLDAWRMRIAGSRTTTPEAPAAGAAGFGLDAGLIAVTTSGHPDFFDLKPGQGKPADVPVLRKPAMVYFVHSFSAAWITNRESIAGVWDRRGAYAYLGAVDEPFLQTFIPTPDAMARLADGGPWGAAVRPDGMRVWKQAVLGDPLITLGPRGPRNEKLALPLPGVEDIAAGLATQLSARDFRAALITLGLTARDKDAAKLLGALARGDEMIFTPEVALAGLGSAFFAGDQATFVLAATRAIPLVRDPVRIRKDGLDEVRDMVWQALWPSIGFATRAEADLLGAMVRPDLRSRDEQEAARAARSSQP